MSHKYIEGAPSVPPSSASPAVTQHLDNLTRHAPGTVVPEGVERTWVNPGTSEYEAVMPVVELKRYAIELRFGPTMMAAAAEIEATSIDTIMATISNQGGLRLTTKLPTQSSAGNSFQKGAFVFTQSIHSIVILEEIKS